LQQPEVVLKRADDLLLEVLACRVDRAGAGEGGGNLLPIWISVASVSATV